MLDGTLQAAATARSIAIEPDLTSADAFVTIGFECLRHIASNEAAVRRGDPEGIHQMRVGLRRLRAALSLFKDMLQGQEMRTLKADFEWLAEQLGPARDYEVLVSEAVSPLRERHRNRVGFGLLEKHLKHERDKGLTKAKAAVESDRYRRILLNTALWLLDGEWRMNHDPLMVTLRNRPLADIAADEIKRRSRKIFKGVRKFDTMNSRRRHKLRIAVKKMRYACEFLETPLADRCGRKKLSRFNRALKALQSKLGQLNDMAVHHRLSDDFARAAPATAFAAGYLLGRESANSEPLLRATRRSGKDLRKAALFS
jgi:CHAD domain-containing protein